MPEEINEAGQPQTVTVSKKALDEVLRKLEVLEAVADKNELQKFYERNRDRNETTCRLSTLRDDEGNRLVVTNWKLVTNDVFIGPGGRTVAKQVVKVTLENGEERTLDLLDYGRAVEKIEAKVLEKSKKDVEENGAVRTQEVWKVKSGSKEFTLDVAFVN